MSLRDPTHEELYSGPTRDKLPQAIQVMTNEDTACTFCGVSYFVFAEVQSLKGTVKKYKHTFHTFVRYLQQEKAASQSLKRELNELQNKYHGFVESFRTSILVQLERQLKEQNHMKQNHHRDKKEMEAIIYSLTESKNKDNQRHEVLRKQLEENYLEAQALLEQKLRNEILHLSSQLEQCKLVSKEQELSYQVTIATSRSKIKALEMQCEDRMTKIQLAIERQQITERDRYTQQLTALTEQLQMEKDVSKQLSIQLSSIQTELSRVLATLEDERLVTKQQQNEILSMSHQIQTLGDAISRYQQLERAGEESLDSHKKEVLQLRNKLNVLEKKLVQSHDALDQVKIQYLQQLESLRQNHGQEIHKLQQDHRNTMESLKNSHQEYIKYLEEEAIKKDHSTASAVKTYQDNMQNELQQLQHQQAELTNQIRAQNKELENWASKLKEADSTNERLSSKIQTLEIENNTLKSKVSTIQDIFAVQLNDEKRLSEDLRIKMDLQEKKSAKEIEVLNRHVSSLQKSFSRQPQNSISSESESEGNEKCLNNLHAEIKQLKQCLLKKEHEIAVLQQTVHQECTERTSLIERLRSTRISPDNFQYPMSPVHPPISTKNLSMECDTERQSVGKQTTQEPVEVLGNQKADDLLHIKSSLYEKLRRTSRKSKLNK